MTVEPSDLTKGIWLLRSFGAQRIWLFGSSLHTPEAVRDIDFACEGIPPENFYEAIGRLLDELKKPVDLVDLSVNTRLTRYIRSHARLLYEA